jgi:hypothetical protein
MRYFVRLKSFGDPHVRRAQTSKFGKQNPDEGPHRQIALFRWSGKEMIEDVVGKRSAVAQIGGGKRRIEMRDAGQ